MRFPVSVLSAVGCGATASVPEVDIRADIERVLEAEKSKVFGNVALTETEEIQAAAPPRSLRADSVFDETIREDGWDSSLNSDPPVAAAPLSSGAKRTFASRGMAAAESRRLSSSSSDYTAKSWVRSDGGPFDGSVVRDGAVLWGQAVAVSGRLFVPPAAGTDILQLDVHENSDGGSSQHFYHTRHIRLNHTDVAPGNPGKYRATAWSDTNQAVINVPWNDDYVSNGYNRTELNKNLANKIFGCSARCEFWVKSGSKFWIL